MISLAGLDRAVRITSGLFGNSVGRHATFLRAAWDWPDLRGNYAFDCFGLLGQYSCVFSRVANSANTSVTWSVSGATGGNSDVGFISPAGVYTATVVMPTRSTIIITATSDADSSRTATAMITVSSDITVEITPHAEPLDGPLSAADAFRQVTLCRNPVTDAGWPPPACITPSPYTGFSTRLRAGP